jgi:hypothetical protein
LEIFEGLKKGGARNFSAKKMKAGLNRIEGTLMIMVKEGGIYE